MERRNFIITTCAFCAGAAGITTFLNSCKKNNTTPSPQGPTVNFTLDLSQSSNSILNTIGGSLASNGVVVVNLGGSFTAIAQACTHEGCNVGYIHSSNNFVCPCHNGIYDVDGNVSSGPPPAPLKKYTVTKNGNIITVIG